MVKKYPKNKDYLVTDKGKIYSKKTKKFLTPKKNHDGYFRIQIWKNGKCNYISWHRIIAETFLDNPLNLKVVNHIDGNKQNNRLSNLEWCTQKENINHAWKTGLSTRENHSKFGEVIQFDAEGNKIDEFSCVSVASKLTGISYYTILNSCKKKTGARKNGYYWRFKKL